MSVARVHPSLVAGRLRAPGSKSYTHRFVLAAHLSGRPSRIRAPLVSDDTLRTVRAVRRLGSTVTLRREEWQVGPGELSDSGPPRVVDCGQSGTTLRLLAASAALRRRRFRFVGDGRLPRRPMEPLFGALTTLGAEVRRPTGALALPFEVRGPLHGGTVELAVEESSQFTSALLFALPTVRPASRILTVGTEVSEPYVRATIAVLRRQGLRVRRGTDGYSVPGGQRYAAVNTVVPGDASSAAYLWAAAAITGGTIRVDGLPDGWPQADLAVIDLLRDFGAEISRGPRSVTVRGGDRRPFRIDLTASPDLFPLAGVLAAVGRGRSHLLGGTQVVAKESNRRLGTARLARALGAAVADRGGRLIVTGVGRPRPIRLRGATDHRMVMSAAVGALAADGPSEIGDATAVAKSFPTFFSVLASVGAGVQVR